MARVRWNSRELDRLLRSRDGEVGRDLAVKAAKVASAQKRAAPVSPHGSHGRPSGYMRNSVTVEIGRDESGLFADIGPTATTPDGHVYPLDVEFGTRPHVIEPKEKQALAWPGAAHPVKKVQHPGTPAQPFIRPSIEVLRGE